MLTHRNLASNALTLVEAWGFTRGDVLLHALPIYHVHGLFVAIHCVLLSGSRMLWLPKFDAQEVAQPAAARDGDDGRADVLHAASGRALVHARELPHDPPVRVRLRTAAAGDVRRVSRAHRAGDPRALRHDRDRHEHVESARRARASAAPWAGRSPASRSASSATTATPCAPGHIGGVEVRGPNVFAGYWRMPEKTREEFTGDGYFKTGDMGEWVAGRPGQGLSAPRRPRQGPHHHRRAQRLSEGDRGAHRRDGRRRRDRRHRRCPTPTSASAWSRSSSRGRATR